MSAVNLWKPRKLPSCNCLTDTCCMCRFVSIAENMTLGDKLEVNFRIWSTPINTFSAPFSSLLHRAQAHGHRRILRIGKHSAGQS